VKHTAPQSSDSITHPHGAPFTVHGAHNVFLETIKRGEDDSFNKPEAPKTIILRLYEAYGGHATAKIHISHHLKIKQAYLTNMLEDNVQELSVSRSDDGVKEVSLSFHGFQVRTLKLVVDDKQDLES
jgi:alpha-mannosidase